MAARSQMVSLRRGELRAKPPGVRADPEEAVMQGCGELQVEVAFADVLRLVRERGAQRGVIPADSFQRQQDAVANGGGGTKIDGEADRKIGFRGREGLRATPEARGEREAEEHAQQQQRGDGEIGGESDLPQRDVRDDLLDGRGRLLQLCGNRYVQRTAGARSAGDVGSLLDGGAGRAWVRLPEKQRQCGGLSMIVRGVDQSAVNEKDGMCSATSAGMASARMRTAVQARLAMRACWTRSRRSTTQQPEPEQANELPTLREH